MLTITNNTTYKDIVSAAPGKKIFRSCTIGIDSKASMNELVSLFNTATVSPRKTMIQSMIAELESLQTLLRAA